ncbi:Golgi SNAP receptor complex member 1 isoform X4 [Chrysemys picta bellii]|uniref:Golgi SNAP receptor complex member 1 isoform X4 n=1 Tax=Chrysemys picta bellii TaxID=8478 RepID=UPI0032B29D2F
MRWEAFTSRRSQRPGGTLWLLSSIARARGAGGRLTLITNMAAGSSSNYWEDLRKQARQLENELDLKLVSFSKLCTSYSHSSAREGRRDRYSSDTTPLLNGSSQDRMFETMAVEIEQLLGRLTGINDKMAEYTNSAGVPSLNAALMHTLQRHRDILQDYTHEFHKTKTNFLAVRERENLLGSVRKDIESYKSGSGVNNRRTELFLKEHEHLRNSDRLIEETISEIQVIFGVDSATALQRQLLDSAILSIFPAALLLLIVVSQRRSKAILCLRMIQNCFVPR